MIKILRLLGDEARLRILRLLQSEQLSVAELQDILGMGQSRISMQLAQLKQAGIVELRRSGQKNIYSLRLPPGAESLIPALIDAAVQEIPGSAEDARALEHVLRRRKDRLREYFDELAGRFGRNYVPGRSWKGLAEMMLNLLPPLVIADLGAGEGTLSLLLTRRAERVIAVDSSQKMVEYGTDVARRHGVENLEYRQGDLEELPVCDASVDLALFHQSLHHALHPSKALAEAARILRPEGRVVVMDLRRHRFEEAREMYADVWLGFTEAELMDLLSGAGFGSAEISVVHREDEPPHFETLLAIAQKATV